MRHTDEFVLNPKPLYELWRAITKPPDHLETADFATVLALTLSISW
jgi:hypothetical protein